MPPTARPAPEAFRRGLSAVVANPGLILAPLTFAAATFASIAGLIVLGIFLVGSPLRLEGMSALSREPAQLVDRFRDFLEGVLAAPFMLIGGLFSLLVLLLLLTFLAAYVRAGVTGCLLAIDARAAEGAPLAMFRHPGLRALFFSSARKNTVRVFALVNLYGIALSCVALLLLLPIGLAVFAGASERGAIAAVALALFLLVLAPAFGASIAFRVLYLVACRLTVSEDVDALEAVGRAVAWTRASLSRTVLLYLLTLAAGFVTGVAFLVPRFALSLAGGHSLIFFVLGTGVIVLAQMLVGLAYDLTVSGAFVSLWPAGRVP
ncbi:MAG: hypothetical protein PT977_10680 [Acidobacteriota bacterium]|nr:hypothetical protein [Acidobacteriota bacterium]